MGLLRCRQLDTGSDVFLIADMNIRCYDSTHSSWLFLFFLLFILYIVGIPLGLNTLVSWRVKLGVHSACVAALGSCSRATTSPAPGGGRR